jgi:lipopolysaccharide biosynthesis glycosyltransferase
VLVPLVTACNETYFPGLRALYRSYLANAGEGFDFYCIVEGDEELFAKIEELGIKTIKPTAWADVYPLSEPWPVKIKSLFADLQIPQLFPNHEKAIWIDADCLIVGSIEGLLDYEFDQPVATCFMKTFPMTLGYQLLNCPPEIANVQGPFTGLIIFNIPEWNRLGLTEKCAEAMAHKTITFKFCDQSVLGFVVLDNWFKLPMKWQTFAHRQGVTGDGAIILHWLLHKPWPGATPYRENSHCQRNMQTQQIWNRYGL